MNNDTPKKQSIIRAARVARGMTQAQVAAEIGYSASYYAMVEREPRLLRYEMAARIAQLLELSPAELGITGDVGP